MKISYDCEDLIAEIKSDISEFGENDFAYAIIKQIPVKLPLVEEWKNYEFIINYLIGEQPPTVNELEGGRAELSTLGNILKLLEEQNRIL